MSWSVQKEIDDTRANEARCYQWAHDRDDFKDWIKDGEFDRLTAATDGPDKMKVANFVSMIVCHDGVFPFADLLRLLTKRGMAETHALQDRLVEYIAGKYADAVQDK